MSRRAKSAVPVFAALGDETRLKLVVRLCTGGPMSITRLSSGAQVTRQAITKHLHVLEHAGIVRGRQRGRERIWEVNPQPLVDAKAQLDAISRQWDAAIERLRALVENSG